MGREERLRERKRIAPAACTPLVPIPMHTGVLGEPEREREGEKERKREKERGKKRVI